MTPDQILAAVREGRDVLGTIRRGLAPVSPGAVAISGMLAEQLAREFGGGAEPGAVVVDPPDLRGTEVVVRVIAGVPSEADLDLIREADRAGVSVVLVQLWPQEDWTPPFLLSPFVVECRAGAGFPLHEIAGRIGDATERAPALATRIPVLRDAVAEGMVRQAVARAAVVGALSGRARAVRPLLALEQVGMLVRLRSLAGGTTESGGPASLAGPVALVLAAGFGLRAVARIGRRSLPAPLVDTAVAAAGTWALAEALRRLAT